jgi:predicted nicotinamide N-methyase
MPLGRIARVPELGGEAAEAADAAVLAGFDLVEERVAAGAVELTIARPRSAEDLIDEEEYEHDERLPYWAELWPSGRALADALAAVPLAGARVLELGCGLGLPAIVARAGGAEVLATDWYPEALAFARANARIAGLGLETAIVDWRDPPPALMDRAPFDLVIAADVLYEARNVDALLGLLPRLVAPAGGAWIADPRRPDSARLLEGLAALGWSHGIEVVPVACRRDESGPIVIIHRLVPPAPAAGASPDRGKPAARGSGKLASADDPR